VPAEKATLHVVDAVLTRMGARDNLALGRSTFLEVSLDRHLFEVSLRRRWPEQGLHVSPRFPAVPPSTSCCMMDPIDTSSIVPVLA